MCSRFSVTITFALSFIFHRSPPTGGHYASPGALIKKALQAVILKKGNTSYSKLSASQAMLDAGCAALDEAEAVCTALLEDAAGCTTLLEVDGRCREAPKPLYLRVR